MSRIKRYCLVAACLLLFWSPFAMGLDQFVVKHIKIEGLHRISQSTVLNYLPVKVGQHLDLNESAHIINVLYDTEFFDDIRLLKRGNTLVIHVVERPTIARLFINGNVEVKTKDLRTALKRAGIVEGRVFQSGTLQAIRVSLLHQYHIMGNYNADVEIKIEHLSDNRVSITLAINEGKSARVREIKIIGNHAFKNSELQSLFSFNRWKIFAFISGSDKYSKVKLDMDLAHLREFYLDRGYLKFAITDHQVTFSEDKKSVNITIHIHEGDIYRIKDVHLSGHLLGFGHDLDHLIIPKPGEDFSRHKVILSVAAMTDFLGDHGYGFAHVNPIPEVDEAHHTIVLNFIVQPGHLVYVRRINFSGNEKTYDEVMRREMRQLEGALYSSSQIKASERRLRLMRYFKKVDSTTVPVMGVDDQVDVDFHIDEEQGAQITLGLGYGTDNGLFIKAGFNQDNFLGTGRAVSISASRSKDAMHLSFSNVNPYYTIDGVSRGITVFARRIDADEVNISNYVTSDYGFTVNYGIPLSENNTLSLGYGYQYTDLTIGSSLDRICKLGSKDVICAFVGDHGTAFHDVSVNVSWLYNGLDRAIFPTIGLYQSMGAHLSIPLGSKSLDYYKLHYYAHYFHPIVKDFILSLRANVAFGDGYNDYNDLPFFKYYHAGGSESVRGFENNGLGPLDVQGRKLGGNFLIDGTGEIILPQFNENFRLSLFLDFGNVFRTHADTTREGEFEFDEIRSSAGIALNWLSPMGPVIFSYAKPLDKSRQDDEQNFAFSFTTGV